MTYNALSHGLPSHCGHPQLALRNVYTLSATSDREDPTVYNGHYSYSLLTIRGPSPSEARSIFTARCYAERGIAMASCPSVCLCLSVHPSVCNVEVSWSYRLEFLKKNLTAITLYRPQHDGSTPQGTSPNFSRNMSRLAKIADFRHLRRHIKGKKG